VFYNVLEKRRNLHGDKGSSVADALVLISRALQHKEGRLSQALKELKRALKLYRASLGDKDPKVSATVDDIAALYMMNDNFVKAALILDEVVKLKTATNGLCNADVAGSLTLLGIAQQSSGDTSNALKSMKKAYTIYVSIEGDTGDQTILTLERIAGIYREGKDHNKAINGYMAVLKAKKMKVKDTNPSVADTYMDIGLCLRDKGDLEKATKCLKQSLTIYVQEKTVSNIEKVAQVLHELGIVHQLRNQARGALKTFKQELAIRRKMGPEELPKVARTLFYLGTVKYDRNDYPAALSFLTEAVSIYETLDDGVGLDFAETLVSIGLVFKATRHADRACQAFLKSLKLFQSNGLGSDHELVKMAAAKLNELGYKCKCKGGKCNQIPCKTEQSPVEF
jgi:tetratricopeptide (TPR) repeat protein